MTHPFLTIGCYVLTIFNIVLAIGAIDIWWQHTNHWYNCLGFIIAMAVNALFSFVAADSFSNCDHGEEEEDDRIDDNEY